MQVWKSVIFLGKSNEVRMAGGTGSVQKSIHGASFLDAHIMKSSEMGLR